MEWEARVRKLASMGRSPGPVVTITLDVSKSGVLPAEARTFVRDRVLAHRPPELARRVAG
ncbi:MAG: hypothetical protein HYY16_11635 [Planctomycetes bacterium]|nr:hypothetical protein [Planctomycetota bacterium]